MNDTHNDADATDPLAEAIRTLADEADADVYLISAPIERKTASDFYEQFAAAEGRENCLVVLCTYGGDPHAAYIMARFLRRAYENVTIVVFGYCKSAGTLLALGGHEIVMGARGELGPLDVQRVKDDDLFSMASGLDIFQSVLVLKDLSYQAFEANFLQIVSGGQGAITTKTAADIATGLTQALISPIASQIDPIRMGEEYRAVRIAAAYGERLGVSRETLDRLTGDYPSHGFVIDLEEASELFGDRVRAPTDAELALEAVLSSIPNAIYHPASPAAPLVVCLTISDDPDERDTHDAASSAVGEEHSDQAGGADAPDGGGDSQVLQAVDTVDGQPGAAH